MLWSADTKYILFSQILLLLIGTGFNTGWSSIYALTFVLLSANAMVNFFENGRYRWCMLASVFAVITFLYRQPVGFCILLAGVCFPRSYLVGSILGFVISVAWSFFWNSRKVFTPKPGEKRALLPSLLKTYASYAFSGVLLSNLQLLLWIEVLHLSAFIAPVLSLLLTVPINFLLNKYWAFGNSAGRSAGGRSAGR